MQCPSCGANLQPRGREPRVECTYCETTVANPDAGKAGAHGRFGPLVGLLADRDGDGVPDMFAAAGAGAMNTIYEVDGVRYDSIEDMPPDLRRLFEEGRIIEMGDSDAEYVTIERNMDVAVKSGREVVATLGEDGEFVVEDRDPFEKAAQPSRERAASAATPPRAEPRSFRPQQQPAPVGPSHAILYMIVGGVLLAIGVVVGMILR